MPGFLNTYQPSHFTNMYNITETCSNKLDWLYNVQRLLGNANISGVNFWNVKVQGLNVYKRKYNPPKMLNLKIDPGLNVVAKTKLKNTVK